MMIGGMHRNRFLIEYAARSQKKNVSSIFPITRRKNSPLQASNHPGMFVSPPSSPFSAWEVDLYLDFRWNQPTTSRPERINASFWIGLHKNGSRRHGKAGINNGHHASTWGDEMKYDASRPTSQGTSLSDSQQ